MEKDYFNSIAMWLWRGNAAINSESINEHCLDIWLDDPENSDQLIEDAYKILRMKYELIYEEIIHNDQRKYHL